MINGFCLSEILGYIKYDFFICLVSDILFFFIVFWVYMYRCFLWFLVDVVRSIVKNGCYFVLIGYKLGNYKDNEWRIFFVVFEYEFVCLMNYI